MQVQPMQMRTQMLAQELVTRMPVRVMQTTLMRMQQLIIMRKLKRKMKIQKRVRAVETLVPAVTVLVAHPLLEVNH